MVLEFKKKNKKNIYFVGGSVTFGKGVKQENTFTGILNKEIEDYNIINAGVVGSNLENNIEIIRTKINKKNLKYIFINYSLDDLANIDTIIKFKEKNIDQKNTLYEKLKNNNLINYLNKFIRNKSVIYIMLKGYIFDIEKNFYQQALNFYKVDNNLKMLEKLIGNVSKLESYNKIIFIIQRRIFNTLWNTCTACKMYATCYVIPLNYFIKPVDFLWQSKIMIWAERYQAFSEMPVNCDRQIAILCK